MRPCSLPGRTVSSTASMTPGSWIACGALAAIWSLIIASWLPRVWYMRRPRERRHVAGQQVGRLHAVDPERVLAGGVQAGDAGRVERALGRDLVLADDGRDGCVIVGAERHDDLVGADGEQLGVVDHHARL